jgi:ABC-type Na+ efflux pump permease subunit
MGQWFLATARLAKKDLRLLLRDRRAVIILLAMPLLLILVLGVSLGRGFGQKPDERLRVAIVIEDHGPPRFFDRPAMIREVTAWLAATPGPAIGGINHNTLAALALAGMAVRDWFPHQSWAAVVRHDLENTAGIKVDVLPSRTEGERQVRAGERAAVLVFGPDFSKRVSRCSFLAGDRQQVLVAASVWPHPALPVNLALAAFFNEGQEVFPLYLLDGINPFYRDGVHLDQLDVQLLRDPTQLTAASIIEQVAQGTLLRVILPWMIGRAFEKIGDVEFIDDLNQRVVIPVPVLGKTRLNKLVTTLAQKQAIGNGVQQAIQQLFPKYNLTAKTWTALTRSVPETGRRPGAPPPQEVRYQILVPSYTVMFAFFLVLTMGWLFAAERRQGTLKRLRAAPLSRSQILLGKLLPCFLLSVGQGFFLLGAGKLAFGMDWGPDPLWVAPVVLATSLAAVGMALLVAAMARTENQVGIYGTVLVFMLAGISGCMMGDRALMSPQMQEISRITPHAWALDAYRQLLTNPAPNFQLIGEACAVLAAFGIGFTLLAWATLRLE